MAIGAAVSICNRCQTFLARPPAFCCAAGGAASSRHPSGFHCNASHGGPAGRVAVARCPAAGMVNLSGLGPFSRRIGTRSYVETNIRFAFSATRLPGSHRASQRNSTCLGLYDWPSYVRFVPARFSPFPAPEVAPGKLRTIQALGHSSRVLTKSLVVPTVSVWDFTSDHEECSFFFHSCPAIVVCCSFLSLQCQQRQPSLTLI